MWICCTGMIHRDNIVAMRDDTWYMRWNGCNKIKHLELLHLFDPAQSNASVATSEILSVDCNISAQL